MARITMVAVVCAAWIHAARAEDPPRYRFDVGWEIVYATTSEYRYRFLLGVASETLRRSAETRIRVVRRNADGSSRLLVKHTDTREDEEPEIEFGWCDVQPDGHFVLGPTLGGDFDASAIFKPLPPPDEREWRTRGGRGERLRLRIGEDGAVEETVESGQLAVGGATCTSRCVLRGDGLPERIETVWAKADPAQGRRTTTTVLVESKRGDPAAATTLDREVASYAQALDRWTVERLRAADEAGFRAAMERGSERLRALRKDVKSAELREELDRCLAGEAEAREAMVAEWRECARWHGNRRRTGSLTILTAGGARSATTGERSSCSTSGLRTATGAFERCRRSATWPRARRARWPSSA